MYQLKVIKESLKQFMKSRITSNDTYHRQIKNWNFKSVLLMLREEKMISSWKSAQHMDTSIERSRQNPALNALKKL